MRGRIFFTAIFTTLFFAAFFIFNAGAQSETFIAAETLQDTACSSEYTLAGQFTDGDGNNVYLCVKRQEFAAGNSYVRESYFEMASGNECIDADNNLIKVGSFNDVNEKAVFLCRRAQVIDEGSQSLLISDVTVREDECPSDYVQSGPVINVAGGKKIKHCAKFKDSQRGGELDDCGGYTFDAGNECVYDISPGGDGADVDEELKGVLRGGSSESCSAEANCVCRGANIYPQSAGWECSIAGGSGEGSGGSDGSSGGGSGGGESSVGECTDSDGSPSNVEEIANSESIFTKGEVREKNETRNVTFVFADSCEGEFVLEAYCDANGAGQKEKVSCSDGKSCFLGRCVDPLSSEFENTCILSNAIWADESLNEISSAQGGITKVGENGVRIRIGSENVFMIVHANSPACLNKEVLLTVFEEDLLRNVRVGSNKAKITSDGDAIKKITFEWAPDHDSGDIELGDNPELFFQASILGDQRIITSELLELFPPSENENESEEEVNEIKWEKYSVHTGRCPKDKFLVGKSESGSNKCAELKAGDKKVVWEGEVRKSGSVLFGKAYCYSNEGAVDDGLMCVGMKIQGGENVVRLPNDVSTRNIKKTGECAKTQVIYFKSLWSVSCGVSLKPESLASADSESENEGSSSDSEEDANGRKGLFSGGLGFVGDILKLVFSIFGGGWGGGFI